MRPQLVQMEGFSTFREPTEIVFDSVDLVAFVGPTGSGKSTIIDAICFALYGSVARYDDARLVAPVINQQSNEAKVRLDFELAGQKYTAVRVVRRTKTGATTREARLQRHDPDEVLASGAKELTAAVESLIGLDFAQFTRTVVLPQGQFAEFLKDDPASRQRLLRRLLDLELYSQMGSTARERAKAATQQAQALSAQIERFEDATTKNLDEAASRVGALVGYVERSAAGLAELRLVESGLEALRTKVTLLDANLASLGVVEPPAGLAEHGQRLEQANQDVDAKQAEVVQAREARDVVQATVARLGEPAAIQAALDAQRQLDSLTLELAELGKQSAAAQTKTAEAEIGVAKAAEQSAAAEKSLRIATDEASAAAFIPMLRVGEDCPVCRQSVQDLPSHDAGQVLTDASSAAAQAQKLLRTAESAERAAKGTLKQLVDSTNHATKRRDVAASRIAAGSSEAQLQRQLGDAEAAKLALGDATRSVSVVEQAASSASKSQAALIEAEQGQRTRFGQQRDGVSILQPPEPANRSLAQDWATLSEWAQRTRVELDAQRSDVAVLGKTEAAKKGTLIDALLGGADSLSIAITPGDLLGNADAILASEVERAKGVRERLAERLAQRHQLEADVKRLEEQSSVQAALGRELSAKGFERWLLAEAVDDLVARATTRLLELSSGQYSLATNDTAFTIIDHHNADEQRDVRTLSGGETFLASLALALALSDSIADLAPVDAPRLGSVFLDEGFGTLDPETLDVVASAIEDLSATGRLVGIVTHIDALAQRMPTQFVVTKSSTTSSVERVTV